MESASVVLWGFTGPFCATAPRGLARSSPSIGSLHPFTPGQALGRSRAQARHVVTRHKTAKFP